MAQSECFDTSDPKFGRFRLASPAAAGLRDDPLVRGLDRWANGYNARPQCPGLEAMNHCLADESARKCAQKRGAGSVPISLDLASAEQHFDLEPAGGITPDQAFDQQWATALLGTVLDRLEVEYQREGKSELFAQIKSTLIGTREAQPYGILGSWLPWAG